MHIEVKNCLPATLQAADPAGQGEGRRSAGTLDEMLARCEREFLTDAIARHDGNLSAAGRELGLSPRMMNYRMNRLGLTGKK